MIIELNNDVAVVEFTRDGEDERDIMTCVDVQYYYQPYIEATFDYEGCRENVEVYAYAKISDTGESIRLTDNERSSIREMIISYIDDLKEDY